MRTNRSLRHLMALLVMLPGLNLSLATYSGSGGSDAGSIVLNVGATTELTGMGPAVDTRADTPFMLLYDVYETLARTGKKGEIKPLPARP